VKTNKKIRSGLLYRSSEFFLAKFAQFTQISSSENFRMLCSVALMSVLTVCFNVRLGLFRFQTLLAFLLSLHSVAHSFDYSVVSIFVRFDISTAVTNENYCFLKYDAM
jgi:hypothetical protein